MDFIFESVNKELGELSLGVAEMHGVIAGTLCVTNNTDKAVKSVSSFFDAESLEPTALEIIKNISGWTFEQLQDDNFAFKLLLPNDEAALSVRTEAMVLWAQGFISGLGEGALSFEKNSQSELREMFDDVVAISQADTDTEESDEGEQYYAELTEYLRIIVMTFYLDFLSAGEKKLPSKK